MTSSGLSNALHDLASGTPQPQQRSDAPADLHEDEGIIVGEIDDESGEIGGAAPYASNPVISTPGSSSPRRSSVRKTKKNDGLKAVFAPVLLTTGILLLIPAVWSVLLLSGMQVWQSERDDARSMAMAMLISWPIALLLLVAGGWMLLQVLLAKKEDG